MPLYSCLLACLLACSLALACLLVGLIVCWFACLFVCLFVRPCLDSSYLRSKYWTLTTCRTTLPHVASLSLSGFTGICSGFFRFWDLWGKAAHIYIYMYIYYIYIYVLSPPPAGPTFPLQNVQIPFVLKTEGLSTYTQEVCCC